MPFSPPIFDDSNPAAASTNPKLHILLYMALLRVSCMVRQLEGSYQPRPSALVRNFISGAMERQVRV